MRTIKFRAWHPEDKVMVYDLNSLQLFHGVLQPDDYILMQFTGLHDRNKKEIFEGDILLFSEANYSRVVRWNEEDPGFSFGKSGFVFCKGNEKLMQVIGNIYEHAELLEAAQ